MKRKIFFVVLSLITFNTFSQNISDEFDYSVPRTYNLAGVNVEGNGNINENIIIAYAGLALGKELSIPGNEISKAIRNLWKQKLFADISIVAEEIKGNNIYLLIKVKSRARLSKYSFKGIKKSDAEKLRGKISLVRGEIVTKQLLQNVNNKIKKFYIEKGYYNSTVKIERIPDTTFGRNNLHLKFDIDKGERIRIEELEIVGNESVKIGKIRRLLKKTNENNFLNIFRSSKFIKYEFKEDKKKVVEYYNSLGYRDARIIEDSVYIIDEKSLGVKIKIFEGNKYYIRNISWTGNTKYTTDNLNRVLGIGNGDIYNPQLLTKKLNMNPTGVDISSLYMDNGYLFFSIQPIEVLIKNDSVDLEMRIFEGPQATINHVSVTGNTRTSDHVIMRELRTRPGKKFSRTDIIRSQRELSQLGFFDPEQMNVIPTPNPEDGTVDLEYKVVEKPSDQLQLQGGWGAGRFVGSLGFVFNNFSSKKIFKFKEWRPLPSGDGQRLSIRFQSNAIYYSSFNFSFTEPWFGGRKPNSFTISLYRSIQSNGAARESTERQQIQISGITIGLGKRLRFPDDYFTLYNSIAFQRYNLDNYQYEFSFTDGISNNFNFLHLLSRNSIDQPIYPRTGSKFSLSLQWTPPFSYFSDVDYKNATDQVKYKWMEYHKWKYESSWFINIFDKLVLNSRMEFGFLGLYNRDIGITPFERFYVGGDGLSGYHLDGRELIKLRGYENNSLTAESATEKGGTIYNKYTFELRYPVSLNPSATVYGLVFAEAGNSWLKFNKFNPFDVHRSVGAGIRIFMPMFGLLGFDWGYGFDNIPMHPTAHGSNFHISIGQQF
ncbi:MAG: outer membrane protein assembly factor BamA [Bacteroidota bacterium]|nr:outer membrane protein assembly factor BamA [Bacteroidota bacterium]